MTEFLNDMTYLNLNSFVTCFSMPDHKPSAPSNRVNNPKDLIDRSLSPTKKKENSERFFEEGNCYLFTKQASYMIWN